MRECRYRVRRESGHSEAEQPQNHKKWNGNISACTHTTLLRPSCIRRPGRCQNETELMLKAIQSSDSTKHEARATPYQSNCADASANDEHL
jgi:hypothetical protein